MELGYFVEQHSKHCILAFLERPWHLRKMIESKLFAFLHFSRIQQIFQKTEFEEISTNVTLCWPEGEIWFERNQRLICFHTYVHAWWMKFNWLLTPKSNPVSNFPVNMEQDGEFGVSSIVIYLIINMRCQFSWLVPKNKFYPISVNHENLHWPQNMTNASLNFILMKKPREKRGKTFALTHTCVQ